MQGNKKILRSKAAAAALAILVVVVVVAVKSLGTGQSQRSSSWLRKSNPSLGPPPSKTGGGKIALVRPASPHDVDPLLSSFDLWLENKFPPCGGDSQIKPPADGGRQQVDLIISFSRQTDGTKKMAEAAHELFEQTKGWNECFDRMFVVECGLSEDEDIYSEKSQDTDFMWVNGPNQQFRETYYALQNAGYDSMFLMEADTYPLAEGWLTTLLAEIDQEKPFGVLGSKYMGRAWTAFKHRMPHALVEHINGNAIYNLTSPLLNRMVRELETESRGLYNAVSYDYRLSQIFFEASGSISSKFPFPRLYGSSDPEVATPLKMAKFRAWWEEMGYTGFFKQSKVVANFGLKNVFEDLNDALIVHGKQYNPMAPAKGRRHLAVNRVYPMFKNAKEEFDKKTDVPFLWLIHGTGNLDRYLAACLRLVSASQSGVAPGHGHEDDDFLAVVGIGKERFVNIDTVHEEGIQRAVEMGFPGSGLADVVVSPLIDEATDLFSTESQARIFTVFQHPVHRALSMFKYLGSAHWEPTYQPQFKNWTLEQFAESDFVESNWVTRMLSNNMETILSDDDFKLAADVLRNKILVGLAYNLPETTERVEKFFRWKFRHNPEEQEQCRDSWLGKDSSIPFLDEDSRAWQLLSDQNAYDMDLYEIALQVWKDQEAWFTEDADGFRKLDATCCECDPATAPVGFVCGVPNSTVTRSLVGTQDGLPPRAKNIENARRIRERKKPKKPKKKDICPTYDPNCIDSGGDPTSSTDTSADESSDDTSADQFSDGTGANQSSPDTSADEHKAKNKKAGRNNGPPASYYDDPLASDSSSDTSADDFPGKNKKAGRNNDPSSSTSSNSDDPKDTVYADDIVGAALEYLRKKNNK